MCEPDTKNPLGRNDPIIKKLKIKLKTNKGYSSFEIDLKKVKRLHKKGQFKIPSYLCNDSEIINYIEVVVNDEFNKKASARIINYPKKYTRKPGQLRIKDIHTCRVVEGEVAQVDSIKPLCLSAKFECPSCGSVINVLQMDVKFREPRRCKCGRKGRFRVISKGLIDSQIILLKTDKIEVLPLLLDRGLVYNKIKAGDYIKVVGFVETKPYIYNRGPSRFSHFQIKVNNFVK